MDQQPIVKNKRDDLIYPESSYKIIGCAFEVYNELGHGYAEKIYQKAFAIAFNKQNIRFKEQVYFPVEFLNEIITKGYSNFVVEEKIIVELKKNDRFSKSHYRESKSI